jgi:hypothetical protein
MSNPCPLCAGAERLADGPCIRCCATPRLARATSPRAGTTSEPAGGAPATGVGSPLLCPECGAEPLLPGALIGDACASRDVASSRLDRPDEPAARGAVARSLPPGAAVSLSLATR